eukprot:190432_1
MTCHRTVQLRIAATDTINRSIKIYPHSFHHILDKNQANKFQIVSCHGKVGTGKSTMLNDIYGDNIFPTSSQQDRYNRREFSCTNGIFATPSIFDTNKINDVWPTLHKREIGLPKDLISEKYKNCGMLFWDVEGQGHNTDPHLDSILNAFVALCSSVMYINTKHIAIGDVIQELNAMSKFAEAMNCNNFQSKLGTVIVVVRDSEISGELETIEYEIKQRIQTDHPYLEHLYHDIKCFGLTQRWRKWTGEQAREDDDYGQGLESLVQYTLNILRNYAKINKIRVYTVPELQALIANYETFDATKIEELWNNVTVDPIVKRQLEEKQKEWEIILENERVRTQQQLKEIVDEMEKKEKQFEEEMKAKDASLEHVKKGKEEFENAMNGKMKQIRKDWEDRFQQFKAENSQADWVDYFEKGFTRGVMTEGLRRLWDVIKEWWDEK